MGGCLPLARFTRLEQSNSFNNKCLAFNKLVDDILTTSFTKNRVVVISAAWLMYLYGGNPYKKIH